MKTIVFLVIMAFASVAWSAPFLAIPVPIDVTPTQSEISVEFVGGAGPVINIGIVQLSSGGSHYLIYDLAGKIEGQYIFRYRIVDGFGWWSEWSAPFGAGKPGTDGILSIIPN